MSIKRKLREGLLKEEVTMKAEIPVPNNVGVISNIFSQNGYELYLVGGAVRDFLMGNTIKDYDLATNAVPDTVKKILSNAGVRTKATGQHFGVIMAFIEDDEFEIATFRSDSDSGDGRRPDEVTFTDIKTDVNRRDLTINALFYNLHTKEIVDYVGGIEDIKNGMVRTVGEPSKRFEEDKLRILRAIRFAARTGNGLDDNIDTYLKKGYDLNQISSERIRDEFLKSIKTAISVEYLMDMYQKYDMFRWIFPGFIINNRFIDDNDHILVIAHLLMPNEMDTLGKKLNTLNYTINEIKDIRFLMSIPKYLVVDLVPRLKKEQANTTVSEVDILKIGGLWGVSKKILDAFNKYELSIGGGDVMAKYNVKGSDVGEMILKLEIEKFKSLL